MSAAGLDPLAGTLGVAEARGMLLLDAAGSGAGEEVAPRLCAEFAHGVSLGGVRPLLTVRAEDLDLTGLDSPAARSCPPVLRVLVEASTPATQALCGAAGLDVHVASSRQAAAKLLQAAFDAERASVCLVHTDLPDEAAAGTGLGPGVHIVRAGTDVTLVAAGIGLRTALAAAEQVAAAGTSIELLELATLAPLTVQTVEASIKRTGRVLVAGMTEAPGCTETLAALLSERSFADLDAPARRAPPGATVDELAVALRAMHRW